MRRTRPRVSSASLALTAAVALTLAVVPPSGGAPGAKVVGTYRVTITGTVTTETIGNTNTGYGDVYIFRGTAHWSHTYPRVRFQVYPGNSIGLLPNRAHVGTAVMRWDHQSNYCGRYPTIDHESGTTRGSSTLMFGGGNQTSGRNRPFTWTFNLSSVSSGPGSSEMRDGDIPVCQTGHRDVILPLLGGRYQSSVAYTDTNVSLQLTDAKRKGKPGFPLDRVLAGKGFSYSHSGTNRNSRITRDQLRTNGYAYVTDGSVKIVFTPVS